ncbi:hypothetical protein CEXT_546911 [Caerostris extrusa]|uniref:Uncharacterized protein n=1 Tax=Caerostris extrusa TaxID=172846 RepID=A0AAV4VJA4_CAEEX|nr:hypothetical protein CEXT_546911 [Caerostris extrusa]
MVETSVIKNWNLVWIFESWQKMGELDLVCGVCINNEEWLKPLQSAKTGTSYLRVEEWTSCVEFVLTTRNG